MNIENRHMCGVIHTDFLPISADVPSFSPNNSCKGTLVSSSLSRMAPAVTVVTSLRPLKRRSAA